MKVAFLGASVTQQFIEHQTGAPTGYTYFTELLLRDHFGESYSQEIFSYGGNRLSDAGILRVHEAIKSNPDICVIEPLIEDSSRGESLSHEVISYIYECLLKNNIMPVTLFLPSAYCLEAAESSVCAYYISFLKSVGLEDYKCVISLTKQESTSLLRDAFHTNSEGAKKYAGELAQFILSKFSSGIDLSACMTQALAQISPSRFRINAIRCPRSIPFRKLSLNIHYPPTLAKDSQDNLLMVQKQVIGPHSPVVKACLSSPQEVCPYTTSIWDPYCHYKRDSYVTLARFKDIYAVDSKVHIEIDKQMPDYETCRRPFHPPSGIEKLYIHPLSDIYLISDYKLGLSACEMS